MSPKVWWTRGRVTAALRRFYLAHGFAPTSSEQWAAEVGVVGGDNRNIHRRLYPSFASVLEYFSSFREAWTAIGVDVDRGWEPWSETEEWFLREGAGIYSRKELAAILNRTPDAVHRRLYDLGIHSYSHWGWTLNRLERATQISRNTFENYVAWGDLPIMQGSKVYYVDPADLVVVKELDLSKLPPDLEDDMLRSLRRRLLSVLSRADWRATSLYKPQPTRGFARIKTRRSWGTTAKPTPNPNPTVMPGMHARAIRAKPNRSFIVGRIGLVHLVYWAWARSGAEDRTPQWMCRLEFQSQHNRSLGQRVTYSVPLVDVEPVGDIQRRRHQCGCGVVILWSGGPTPPSCYRCTQVEAAG